jgi:hypothetical protein
MRNRVDAAVKKAMQQTQDVDDVLVHVHADLVADVAVMFKPLTKRLIKSSAMSASKAILSRKMPLPSLQLHDSTVLQVRT